MECIVLIGRGKVGWHADMTYPNGRCSSSGGTFEHYLSNAPDGTPIYDAIEADDASFVDFVYTGPMVDPSLKAGEIKRFQDHLTLERMIPGMGGAFKALGEAELEYPGSMDFVAVDVYMATLIRKVPGVKVGKVVSGAVVWA